MIDIKEKALLSFLYNAKEKAVTIKEEQLFSFTKEVEKVDLLHVFSVYNNREYNRIFWSNDKRDFQLLGIGTIHEITRHNGNFKDSQKEWKGLLEHAHIYNPYKVKGTGVTALGGMSFDPTSKQGELWSKYPASLLTVPEYIVTFSEGRYFITVNGVISKDDIISDVLESIHTFEHKLNESRKLLDNKQKVIRKDVIKPEEWKALVQEAVDEIKQQKAKKIVLAREIRVKLNQTANISGMLEKLLATQPNSYIFAFEQGDHCFLGATPERLVLVEGEKLLSTCLAGTAPRGDNDQEDERLANDLLHDDKNLEEHEYVVQMIKENIQDYCKDLHIPKQPVIYPLRNLQHLYTPVTALLKPDYSVFDVVGKLHPTPALGGVPREKALQFIRENECLERGWYGAPVGWLDSNENSEFAVAIRSGLVQKDEVSLFAGCGVMRDSDAEMEFEETKVKFLPMLHVMEEHDESY